MVIDACAELATNIVKNGGYLDLDAPSSSGMKEFVKGWLGSRDTTVKAEPPPNISSVLVVIGFVSYYGYK
jgi:hypothetical protein